MDEKKLRQKALQLEVLLRDAKYSEGDFQQLLNYLDSFNPIELIPLLVEHHDLLHGLMDETYEPYWSGVLARIPVSAVGADFSFKKLASISSLQYIIGYIQYICLTDESAEKDYDAFFALASTYHSYHALDAGIDSLILSLYRQTMVINQDSINKYITLAEQLVMHHGTPWNLALANFYFHLAVINKGKSAALSKDDVVMRQEIVQRMDAYVFNALRNLTIAELLLEDSQDEIHNAYFGQGLIFSNPFGLASIADMKKLLNTVFPDSLLPSTEWEIINGAKAELIAAKERATGKPLIDDALQEISGVDQQPSGDDKEPKLLDIKNNDEDISCDWTEQSFAEDGRVSIKTPRVSFFRSLPLKANNAATASSDTGLLRDKYF